jgi:uncharacterized delta-60 repeat protein
MKYFAQRKRMVLFSFATILFSTVNLLAGPGDLDVTFSGDGKLTDVSGSLRSVAIEPDGRIVAAGPGFLARNLSDGSPDTTFGGTGKVTTGYHAGIIGLQPDGKIVAAGLHDGGDFDMNGFALFRYNVDGSPDDTFGIGGRMIFYVDYGDCCALGDMVLSPVGGIVLVGTVNGEFWGNGFFTDASFPLDYPTDVVLQQDGKKIVTGSGLTARFNSDGSLDTSFGGDGIVENPAWSSVHDAAVQGDGKIIVAGCGAWLGEVVCDSFVLLRYNPNGSLDPTFDGDGLVHTYFGGDQAVYEADLRSLAIEPSGKIVAAGYSEAGFSEGETDFTLVRYNPNGSLDTTFGGGDGMSRVDFNNSVDLANEMALDGLGRAVVVGQSDGAFAIARLRLRSNAPFDYDGDGKTDFSVWRPSFGSLGWYIAFSGSGNVRTTTSGPFAGAVDGVPADYDGDGTTDISEIRYCTESDPDYLYTYWVISNSSNNSFSAHLYPCIPLGKPLPADYDGDGKADRARWYSSDGTWLIDLSNSWEYRTQWGLPGDKPVPADFDGDGKADLAVWRPSDGKWYIASIATGQITVISWGLDGDIPVPGDYNGDGRADFAVYRPSNNTWYRMHSNDYSMHETRWGLPNDIVTPGDYDGDGKIDLAVWRPSDGTWYVLTAANTIYIQAFGLNGDMPTPSAFVY